MSLTTCAVRCRVYKQDGTPDVGAQIVATLNRFDIDEGYVGPVEATAIADENGEATLELWPNQRGATESAYRIRIEGSERSITVSAVVPDTPTANLETIATVPPYPGKTDGEIAAGEAAASAAEAAEQAALATAAASAAAASETVAETSATTAAADAATAEAAATTATTQAGIATTAASSAADDAASAAASAAAAAASEADAEAAATNAADSEAIAVASASTATTQAGIATTQAGIATTAATEAEASATAAAESEATALGTLPFEGDTPPENPLPGSEWIDTSTGRRYTWYNDEVWVEIYASQVMDTSIFGVNQDWQVLTGSRELGQEYTNDTDKAISLALTFASTSTGVAEIYVDDVLIASTSVSSSFSPLVTLPIQVGATYRVEGTGTNVSVTRWSELRS